MIALSPHAQKIERQERAAERERLMQRAFEYAAQKREAERQRALGVVLRIDIDNSVRLAGSSPHPRSAPPPAPITNDAAPTRYGGAQARVHVVHGIGKTMPEWAAFIGITTSGLYHLIKRHGSLEAALLTRRNRPRQSQGRP
ncbi:MAG: hypothetical protein K0S56_1609 [Microvirga sp.]|jgi:hypothetical protein|nr:hypothetical protein [Microvirga sp.]